MATLTELITVCRQSDFVLSALPTDVCAGVPKLLDSDALWIPFFRVTQAGPNSFLFHLPMGSIQVKKFSGEIMRFERYPANNKTFLVDATQAQKMVAAAERYISDLEVQINGALTSANLQRYLQDCAGSMDAFYQSPYI